MNVLSFCIICRGIIHPPSVTLCVSLATGWGSPVHLPPQHLCLHWGLSLHDPAAILHSLRWSDLPASKYVLAEHFHQHAIPPRLPFGGGWSETNINCIPASNSGIFEHKKVQILFYIIVIYGKGSEQQRRISRRA